MFLGNLLTGFIIQTVEVDNVMFGRRHINVAINKDYMEIQKYAFRKYKIKTIENKHTHLSPEELEKLEKLSLAGRYTKEEFYKLKYCSTVVYMVPRA